MDGLIWVGRVLLSDVGEDQTDRDRHRNRHHNTDKSKAVVFAAGCVCAVAAVAVFGVPWSGRSFLEQVGIAAGLGLWVAGMIDVGAADWRTGSFNIFFVYATSGMGCCLFGAVNGGWSAGLIAGAAASSVPLVERVIRDKGVVWSHLLYHGDADISFMAAFPVAVFSDFQGWQASVAAGFMVYSTSIVLRLLDPQIWKNLFHARHCCMAIFFSGCCVWVFWDSLVRIVG